MTLKRTFVVGLAVAALVSVQAASARPDPFGAQPDPIAYTDSHDRAIVGGNDVISAQPAGHVDRYELDLPSGPAAVEATGSGTEVAWPEVGIGFGVGMAFVLGLILAMRFTRGRPLAHG